MKKIPAQLWPVYSIYQSIYENLLYTHNYRKAKLLMISYAEPLKRFVLYVQGIDPVIWSKSVFSFINGSSCRFPDFGPGFPRPC